MPKKAKYIYPTIKDVPAEEVEKSYKCRDCGTIFEPDPEADGVNCPNCETNNCIPISDEIEHVEE